jgi:uncharacterized small protein (DUF1192 family)
MTTGKDSRTPAHDPKKVKSTEKDASVELSVEELEERIAPINVFPKGGN